MITFTIVGDIDLRNPDGHRVSSVLSQQKRLALLTIVALTRRPVQRDELIGLLWPDVDQAQARHALRQSIHYLRRSLGSEVVKGSEAIELDVGRLTCDAVGVLAALEEGRLEDAVDLFRGDLLPGFYLDGGTAEFERWLEEQRSSIRSAVAGAAWKIAEQERARGNAAAAGAAARRAFELSDWDEAALRRLLELLASVGDRAGAVAMYGQFAERAGAEIGVEPSAATQELVRQISTDTREVPVANPAPTRPAAPAPPATSRMGDPPRRGFAAVGRSIGSVFATAAVAVVFFSLWGVGGGDARNPGPGAYVIYVEPLRDLGYPHPAPALAAALSAELMSEMREAPNLEAVVASGATVRKGTDALKVTSELLSDGDSVRVVALLIDARSGAVLDEVRVSGEAGQTLAAPKLLAGRIATQLRRSIGVLSSMRDLERSGGRASAIESVRKAAAELAIAESLSVAGAGGPAELYYRSADSILARVQSADPRWIEPRLRRAEIALREVQHYVFPPVGDAAAVEARVRDGHALLDAALQLDRDNARALELHGTLSYWAAAVAPPPARDSIRAVAERYLTAAVERDPSRAEAWNLLSALQERRGEFALAYKSARQAYAADRQLGQAQDILVRLFTTALEVGDTPGASMWCAEIHERVGEHWLGSYCDLSLSAWAGSRDVKAIEAAFDRAQRMLPKDPYGAVLDARVRFLYAIAMTRAGHAAMAADAVEGLHPEGSPDPEVTALYAWWLKETDRAPAAVAALERLAQSSPAANERVAKSRRFATLAAN